MSKRKKKLPQLPPSSAQLMNNLFKEATTFAESKKRRVKKTAHNLLHLKTRINNTHNKLVIGSLERHHIQAHVSIVTCSKCGSMYKHVDFLHVWSRSPMEGNSSTRMTTEINSKGMYDLHKDLPITITEEKRFVPSCVECLYIDAETWPQTEEERVEMVEKLI